MCSNETEDVFFIGGVVERKLEVVGDALELEQDSTSGCCGVSDEGLTCELISHDLMFDGSIRRCTYCRPRVSVMIQSGHLHLS